jgi:hypothetical protein
LGIINHQSVVVPTTKKIQLIAVIILFSIYLLWKLIDYLNLMIDTRELFFSIPYLEALLNGPVYLASIFLLLGIKAPFRLIWKITFIIAISDQVFQTIYFFSILSLSEWLMEQIIYIPLYFMGWFYAFKANYIWGLDGYWTRVRLSDL